jgi:anti-sigma factor RsiW
MNCARYTQAIHELVDGTLGAIRRAELQQHLDQCAGCRALVADLERIRNVAATLDTVAPPDGVWLQIAGRLRQEGRVHAPGPAPTSRQSRVAMLAIAAGLIVAVGASLVLLLPILRGGEPQAPAAQTATGGSAAGDQAVQSIEDHFRLAEQHMQTGIAKLEEAAKAEESAMDAQTAAMLKKNLELIDQAIAESRAALRAEPQSTIARNSLFNALRRKVALLQDAVALMNEMRKGDAAGAAQVIEGINKS